ncbi:hypothetical protein ACJX0J_031629, partial [Zea mays]
TFQHYFCDIRQIKTCSSITMYRALDAKLFCSILDVLNWQTLSKLQQLVRNIPSLQHMHNIFSILLYHF